MNPPQCEEWKLVGDSEGKCGCLKKDCKAKRDLLTIFIYFKGSAEKSFRTSEHSGTIGKRFQLLLSVELEGTGD